MTKTELRHIAEDLVDELRELPDGYEITSGQLLAKAGYHPDDMEFEELFDFHDALFRAAKANHIILDMSKHENKIEGLPWNLDFAVRNKKAQIKCPRCGSIDTARILYGMPAMSDELQAKIDSGKIHLGGCCRMAVETDDGTMIDLDPKRYCNHCRKEFASPAYWQNKDLIAAYADLAESVEFQVGGFFGGTTRINIKKNDKGALVHVDCFPYGPETLAEDRQITPLRWMKFINRLFNELYVHEWKKEYVDPEVLDGTQWHLEIKLGGRRKRTIDGSNAYPPYWSELKALLRPFGKV